MPDFSFVLVKAAFEVMKKGEKLEEFRDNTEYWRARLLEAHDKFRQFKHLHFINGSDRFHDPEKRDMQGARATKGFNLETVWKELFFAA